MARFMKFVTYNMRGLNQGTPLLSDLCISCDIIALQEHWLNDYDLHKLINYNNEFIGIAKSAMTSKTESGFLVGRPFGGLAVLVRRSVCCDVTFLNVDAQCRCLSVLITLLGGYRLLVFVLYLPCFQVSLEYTSDLLDCSSFIECTISSTNCDGVVLLGDCNFDCTLCNSGYKLFKGMLDDVHVVSCKDLATPVIDYTYFQDTLGRYSTIDHIFVSDKLYDHVISYSVVESGNNFSDHLPVACTIALPFYNIQNKSTRSNTNSYGVKLKNGVSRWDKADIVGYYYMTGQLLQQIDIPYDLLHGGFNNQVDRINKYYDAIVNALLTASNCYVPTIKHNSLKPYWSAELQQLKEDSIHSHRMWIANGKPRSGWINDFRLRCKYKYKHSVKLAAITFELDLDDELSQHLMRKDMDKFWLKWHKRFSKRNVEPAHINGKTDDLDIANVFNVAFTNNYIDSYADVNSVKELDEKLQNCNSCSVASYNTFSVDDIEEALIAETRKSSWH